MSLCEKGEQSRQTGEGGPGGKKESAGSTEELQTTEGNQVVLKRQPVTLLALGSDRRKSYLKGHVSVHKGTASTQSVCSCLRSTGLTSRPKPGQEQPYFPQGLEAKCGK